MTTPPGGEPRQREPNQYTTPCHLILILGERRLEREYFDDLQMAYQRAKEIKKEFEEQNRERWRMKSWDATVRDLYANHMEDLSGLDVARGPNKTIALFYDI